LHHFDGPFSDQKGSNKSFLVFYLLGLLRNRLSIDPHPLKPTKPDSAIPLNEIDSSRVEKAKSGKS